jgi:hypothetical protein
MSSVQLSSTVHKERQICCTTKKDNEHWATVDEAASTCNGDPPMHDYTGENGWLTNVFVKCFKGVDVYYRQRIQRWQTWGL